MITLTNQVVHASLIESSEWKAELYTFIISHRSTKQGRTITPYYFLLRRPMRDLLPRYATPSPGKADYEGLRSTVFKRRTVNVSEKKKYPTEVQRQHRILTAAKPAIQKKGKG